MNNALTSIFLQGMAGSRYFICLLIMMGSFLLCGAQSDTPKQTNGARSGTLSPTGIKTPSRQPLNKLDTGTRRMAAALPVDTPGNAKGMPDSSRQDSLQKQKLTVGFPTRDTGSYRKYETHPYLPLHEDAIFRIIEYRSATTKDRLFYVMSAILLLLGFIRAIFPKYVNDLFLLFLQTSLRQKQTRDQLLQNNLASLFVNLLFFLSGGLFIGLYLQFRNWSSLSLWTLSLAGAGLLLVVYLFKYLFLLFAGWVFNMKEAAGSYIFFVFMVNKVMGILLIPFLLILAFAGSEIVQTAVTVSLGMLGLLYGYRYIVSFGAVRNKLKVNPLHFFLYLCAVEMLPLLLIYKLIINYIAGSF